MNLFDLESSGLRDVASEEFVRLRQNVEQMWLSLETNFINLETDIEQSLKKYTPDIYNSLPPSQYKDEKFNIYITSQCNNNSNKLKVKEEKDETTICDTYDERRESLHFNSPIPNITMNNSFDKFNPKQNNNFLNTNNLIVHNIQFTAETSFAPSDMNSISSHSSIKSSISANRMFR